MRSAQAMVGPGMYKIAAVVLDLYELLPQPTFLQLIADFFFLNINGFVSLSLDIHHRARVRLTKKVSVELPLPIKGKRRCV